MLMGDDVGHGTSSITLQPPAFSFVTALGKDGTATSNDLIEFRIDKNTGAHEAGFPVDVDVGGDHAHHVVRRNAATGELSALFTVKDGDDDVFLAEKASGYGWSAATAVPCSTDTSLQEHATMVYRVSGARIVVMRDERFSDASSCDSTGAALRVLTLDAAGALTSNDVLSAADDANWPHMLGGPIVSGVQPLHVVWVEDEDIHYQECNWSASSSCADAANWVDGAGLTAACWRTRAEWPGRHIRCSRGPTQVTSLWRRCSTPPPRTQS